METDIAKIDWDYMASRHHMQPNMFDYWLKWREAGSLGELVHMTQEYQSAINRFYIDRLRFNKYRPTGSDNSVHVSQLEPGGAVVDRRLLARAQALVPCHAARLQPAVPVYAAEIQLAPARPADRPAAVCRERRAPPGAGRAVRAPERPRGRDGAG